MVDYLKDTVAKKRHLNEAKRDNWKSTETTPSARQSNKSDSKPDDFLNKYEARKIQLEAKREDRKDQRFEMTKLLSNYEKDKRSENEEEYNGEQTLKEKYESKWRTQEMEYENIKREREKQRRERAADINSKVQAIKEREATTCKKEEEERARVEKWAAVYQSRTTEDSRELAKAVSRIQFQNALKAADEEESSDEKPDFDEDRLAALRNRRKANPTKYTRSSDTDIKTSDVSSWYHTKSLSRYGKSLPTPTRPTATSTSSSDPESYRRRAREIDMETEASHEDLEEQEVVSND